MKTCLTYLLISLKKILPSYFMPIFGSLLFCISFVSLHAQERIAPAYPLITHNPNFSIWSMTDKLNASSTKHWTDADHALLGLIKVDGQVYHFMGKEPIHYTNILPTEEEGRVEVQYTWNKPEGNWTAQDYNAAGWKTGQAPIGDNAEAKTKWTTTDIWVRRTFDVADLKKLNEIYIKLV